MTVSNSIIDFLPSLFFGLPEEETALSVLPGHSLVMEGRCNEAFKYTLIGAMFSTYILILLLPALFTTISTLYSFLENYFAAIIAFILSLLVLREKNKLASLILLVLSGALGLITLNSKLTNPIYIFFPLFSGFFAIPSIITSLRMKTKFPEQLESQEVEINKGLKSGAKGLLAGALSGLMPGFGVSQSIFFVGEFFKLDKKEFLGALGAAKTSSMILSILSLYLIGKARSGASIALEQITQLTFKDALLIIFLSNLAVGISIIFSFKILHLFQHIMENIDYSKIMKFSLIMLISATILITGLYGLLVLFVSSLIGFFAMYTNTKRSYCMGLLILPTFLFYLNITF
jgi:putative membrane protein